MTRVLVWGLALVMALAAALLAGRSTQDVTSVRPGSPPRDLELARCQRLGEAAGQDARCQVAWERARQRFFGGAGR